MVPAFNGMGAPYWNQNVRGAIYGINRNTGKAEIVRATIRSICYQTKDIINLMQKDSSINIKEIKVDGGMVKNDTFIKFLCDILNINIVRPKNFELTSLGVAYLSAIDNNLINLKKIKNQLNNNKIFKPKLNNKTRKLLYGGWLKAVKKTLL